MLPPPPFYQSLYGWAGCQVSYGVGDCFVHLGSAVLAVSLPSFLPILTLLSGVSVWEAEKASTLSKHGLAKTKTLVGYQRCFGHKSKMHNHTSCCEEANTVLKRVHTKKVKNWKMNLVLVGLLNMPALGDFNLKKKKKKVVLWNFLSLKFVFAFFFFHSAQVWFECSIWGTVKTGT